MAWTAVHTFAVGDVLNASDLNTWLTANTQFLWQPPSVGVTHSVGQSIPNASLTNMNMNQERFKQTDTGMHSTSVNSHLLVAVTAGKYFVWGSVSWGGNAGYDEILLQASLGGSTFTLDLDVQSGALSNATNVGKVVSMLAGDVVYLQAYQTSGGAFAVTQAPQYSPDFGMTWVGN